MTIPTDRELSQAYQQGYQDGRRAYQDSIDPSREKLISTLDDLRSWADYYANELGIPLKNRDAINRARAALAKVAQPQPATKGE